MELSIEFINQPLKSLATQSVMTTALFQNEHSCYAGFVRRHILSAYPLRRDVPRSQDYLDIGQKAQTAAMAHFFRRFAKNSMW